MMKPINTAVCSYGMSGRLFHAPFIDANPKFHLYGALERTKNLAKEKYPLIKTFRTLEELLLDDNIKLVILNTPNITHFDFAKKIINAGKHLVVEKPFTATVEEAEELIGLAEQQNVLLFVYHNRRYDSDFRTVQRIINQGILGDIIEAEFHYDRFESLLSAKAHKETPTKAVGNWYDLGSHLIDQSLQLFGFPVAVFASIKTYREHSKVPDYFDVKLFYNAHSVTLKSSYFVLEPLPAYTIHGKKGSFIKTRSDIQESALQKGITPNSDDWGIEPDSEMGLLYIIQDGKSHAEKVISERGNYMEFYDAVYETIANNHPLPISGTEGMLVIKIIEAAMRSNKEERVIYL